MTQKNIADIEWEDIFKGLEILKSLLYNNGLEDIVLFL